MHLGEKTMYLYIFIIKYGQIISDVKELKHGTC